MHAHHSALLPVSTESPHGKNRQLCAAGFYVEVNRWIVSAILLQLLTEFPGNGDI